MRFLLGTLGAMTLSIVLNYFIVKAGYYPLYVKIVPDIIIFLMVSSIVVLINYHSNINKLLYNSDDLKNSKLFSRYSNNVRLNLTLFSITIFMSGIIHYHGYKYVDTTLFTMSLIFLFIIIFNIVKMYKLTGGNHNNGN